MTPISRDREMLKIGVACVVGVLIVLAIFHIVRSGQYNASLAKFQHLEVTAQHILTVLEASYSDREYYPADRAEFNKILTTYDPELTASVQDDETEIDFESVASGTNFSLYIWRKDVPEYRYVCRGDQTCHWDPHLPYP